MHSAEEQQIKQDIVFDLVTSMRTRIARIAAQEKRKRQAALQQDTPEEAQAKTQPGKAPGPLAQGSDVNTEVNLAPVHKIYGKSEHSGGSNSKKQGGTAQQNAELPLPRLQQVREQARDAETSPERNQLKPESGEDAALPDSSNWSPSSHSQPSISVHQSSRVAGSSQSRANAPPDRQMLPRPDVLPRPEPFHTHSMHLVWPSGEAPVLRGKPLSASQEAAVTRYMLNRWSHQRALDGSSWAQAGTSGVQDRSLHFPAAQTDPCSFFQAAEQQSLGFPPHRSEQSHRSIPASKFDPHEGRRRESQSNSARGCHQFGSSAWSAVHSEQRMRHRSALQGSGEHWSNLECMPGVFDCAAPRQPYRQAFHTGQQQAPCGLPATQHDAPSPLSFKLSFSNNSSFEDVVQCQASFAAQTQGSVRDPRLQDQMTQRPFPSGQEQPSTDLGHFHGANGLSQQRGAGGARSESSSERAQREGHFAFRASNSGQQEAWQGRECSGFRARQIMGWTPEVLSYYSTNRAKRPRLDRAAQQQGNAVLGRAAADFAFKHENSKKRQRSTEAALAVWEASKQAAEPEASLRGAASLSRGFRVLGAVSAKSVPRSACDTTVNSGCPENGLLAIRHVGAVGAAEQRWRGAGKESKRDSLNLGSTSGPPQPEHSRSEDSSAQTMAPPCPISRGSSSTPQAAAVADGECVRTRGSTTRTVSSAARKRTCDLYLSREYLASAAHLARKHSFKPLKLAVERSSKRQNARIANLHTAWKQSRLKMYRFVVRPSHIAGLGVFATEEIEEGELLMEYSGEIIRRTIADIREKQGSSDGIYFFALRNELVIDATHAGGIARFINHCCRPNCWAKEVRVDGRQRILILAATRIRAGDELTYDYCLSDAEEGKHSVKKIACVCGALNCRGEL